MRSRLLLISIIAAAAACSTDKPATTDTTVTAAVAGAPADDVASRAEIETLRSGWKAAADKKDAAAVAALYADDAVLVTTESPPANGKAAIQATLTQMLGTVSNTTIDSKDLVIAGNDAYDYGSFKQDVKAADGKTSTAAGYYMVSIKKQADGSWKIYRHVSTTPPVPK
jgi:uncharacterized protein (TIGR02246 family)